MKCLVLIAAAFAVAFAEDVQECVKDCSRPFFPAVQTLDIETICNGLSTYKRCIHRCKHMPDAQVWRPAKRRSPNSGLRQLESTCSDRS